MWCGAISKYNAEILLEYADVSADTVRVLELCVPWLSVTAESRPRAGAPRSGPADLLDRRAIRAGEGPDRSDRAISMLPSVGPGAVQLTLAGSTLHSDPRYVDRLIGQIAELGLAETRRPCAWTPTTPSWSSCTTGRTCSSPLLTTRDSACRSSRRSLPAAGWWQRMPEHCPTRWAPAGAIVPVGDPAALAGAIASELTGRHRAAHRPRWSDHLRRFGLAAFRRRLLHEARRALIAAPGGPDVDDRALEDDRFVRRQRRLFSITGVPPVRWGTDPGSRFGGGGSGRRRRPALRRARSGRGGGQLPTQLPRP